LPDADALALIRAHQPSRRFVDAAAEASARELVGILKGFTLAVETAAIFLGRHAAPGIISAYVRKLRTLLLEGSEGMAGDPTVGTRHKERLLEKTLAITFATLSPEHLHVLDVAALLPADQLALPWIRAVAIERFPALGPNVSMPPAPIWGQVFVCSTPKANTSSAAEPPQGDAAWNGAIKSLLSLRLLRPTDNEKIARIHRLVQEVRKKTAGSGVLELAAAIQEHVQSSSLALPRSWLRHEDRWKIPPLAACARKWMDDPGGGWEKYVPSDAAGSMVELAEYSGAYLGLMVADQLIVQGEYAEAEPLLRRALPICEKSAAKPQSQWRPALNALASTLSSLALLLKATNRLAEAEPLMCRALAIHEKTGSPNVAVLLCNLAEILKETNRLAEAEQLLNRALGLGHGPTVPTILNNLAGIYLTTNGCNHRGIVDYAATRAGTSFEPR